MFAAASGARLAHRHNKAISKKQICTNNIDGLQVNYKTFQKHQQAKYSDTPSIHGHRKPQRCHHNYTSKLYSSDSESVIKLSSSYIDLHGRIPKLGHVDFEGKAAWQDRELGYESDRRESVCVTNEAAATHRFKQKEAHKRWVKRNRIHDATFGDCSSEEEDIYGTYGVQSTAANALLYIGLGTMCIGMIIAFVGMGEKGFKTIELRLIGPSLIGTGVMIIILRVMLCVCSSKCLKFNKHKHKNSTNKLNSEDECDDNQWKTRAIECAKTGQPLPQRQTSESLVMTDRTSTVPKSESKKRVSIVDMPTTSTVCETLPGKKLANETIPQEKATQGKVSPQTVAEVKSTDKPPDTSSIVSDISISSHRKRLSWVEGELLRSEERDPSNQSDISLNSLTNGFLNSDSFDSELSSKTVKNASKFESHRSPKNVPSEIVLNPSNLNEMHESD